jgi:tetratricopeptide (TPR) repeat protein
MSDSKEIDVLNALTDAAKVREEPNHRMRLASIRVSPGSYLAFASVMTFGAALLLRVDENLWALGVVSFAWLVIPALAWGDRITFDGERLTRRGPLPFIFHLISGQRQRLRIADLEKVDTTALRTLRRGGRVRYRYRTQISGKGTSFVFASGGKSFRRMVAKLFPLIHDDKLDLRTRELRDYLCEPKTINAGVKEFQLAPAAVLERDIADFKFGKGMKFSETPSDNRGAAADDSDRAKRLGQLGNRLRIAGRLREAGEAFRRALNVAPQQASLIHDFGRLLRSEASARSNSRLFSRARAALRLAARRSNDDSHLLSLIGESFLECGDGEQARRSFERALNQDSGNFRARMGLADVSLRDGKLAHVIHHYRDASMRTPETALALYARREADYYDLLNEDDDYLSAELSRINWLQNATRVRKLAARMTNASILIAIVGRYIDPVIGGIGWSLASSSLVAWVAALFAMRFLSERRRPRVE